MIIVPASLGQDPQVVAAEDTETIGRVDIRLTGGTPRYRRRQLPAAVDAELIIAMHRPAARGATTTRARRTLG